MARQLLWRRRWMGLLTAQWIVFGTACLVHAWQPLLPWPLAPLHARCMGVMQLALAGLAWPAFRSTDNAFARVPLVASLVFAAGAVAAVLLVRAELPVPAGWVWLVMMFVILAASALALTADHELRAPAEHPRLAWLLLAVIAAAAGVALLFTPRAMARAWPWMLPPTLAWIYAPPLLAFAAVLALLAHERRRYVRAPIGRALMLLAGGVLAASAWHRSAFDWQRLPPWLWYFSFAAVLWLALQDQRRMG